MATGTSRSGRRRAAWLAAFAAIVALAGCGGATSSSTTNGAFSWLHAERAPHGWRVAKLPAAALAYPPGWRGIESDPGTVSAALIGPRRRIVGYLNVTPQQGAETLANWARFRPEHVADEGSRDVRRGAAATNLSFASGHASCVMDSYRTSTDRYREIACLVADSHATTVVVGAAESSAWSAQAPVIERAIDSFAT